MVLTKLMANYAKERMFDKSATLEGAVEGLVEIIPPTFGKDTWRRKGCEIKPPNFG